MTKLFVAFAEGFEEIEAITVVDVLRRADITVDMVGVPGFFVTGSHGVRVGMDKRLSEINVDGYDGIILPGGGKGVANLAKITFLLEIIKKWTIKEN